MLFKYCQNCGVRGSNIPKISNKQGTFMTVTQECSSCQQTFKWSSQSKTGIIPTGNINLASGILFSGSVPSKSMQAMKIAGIGTISRDTYFRYQRKYLTAAVYKEYELEQRNYLTQVKDEVNFAGDGRCDSVGHSAKYCNYTLLLLIKI